MPLYQSSMKLAQPWPELVLPWVALNPSSMMRSPPSWEASFSQGSLEVSRSGLGATPR